ncbi:LysM peptidoglycan-binding domain-containing protein [Domibacillus enclensis]|uniref:Spore germination protein n=1 Tax=Domibacillus enclensis TaxID=1017273 RepID=A0A1N7CZR9_9BACI|nr:glycoside hydrolase family 18 protein [Domibacillus enclensis]OXS73114.1 spore gernimation protein [Domibacillus enclensis]SIR68954.1 spore germination protein [Domibacillus enclensis]
MHIYVVKSGDTLFQIARRYGTTVQAIQTSNQLPNPDQLVIGQALVIPVSGQFHTIAAGDSLWKISRQYGVTVEEIVRMNGLSQTAPLQIGRQLRIPPPAKTRIESTAYIEPSASGYSGNVLNQAREASPQLTYLAPVSFNAKRDGSLEEPPIRPLPAIAEQNGTVFMMDITNLENDQFSADLGHILLTDEKVQQTLLDNISRIAKQTNFRDIHFDFEYLRPEDREAYNRFLRRATERFHREGKTVSTALAPKTSATQKGQWYEAHDYKAHGDIVDFSIIMTYEWGYSGGPPMAVSPIGPVRNVLTYALTEMPAAKIVMGQNLYGYDWTLPYRQGNPPARAISPQEAIRLASRYKASIRYDFTAQAPFIDYIDENGRAHKIWFEDARSIDAKFALLKELKLRGIAYWKIGFSFPQNWLLLGDRFTVKKI